MFAPNIIILIIGIFILLGSIRWGDNLAKKYPSDSIVPGVVYVLPIVGFIIMVMIYNSMWN